MPTLFISYKRDDKVAVRSIADKLRRDYSFDIWIDAVSIPGGEDWRQEIRKGIDRAAVVLLMLTPDACASPQVKEEVDYAKSIGRKILPLQIKKVSNDDDLPKLGVEHLNYIDFVTDDRFAWEKLLNDLPEVSNRDKRRLDPTFNQLHQDYLRSLFTRYEKLSLSHLLDAAPHERVSLFEVYVPLFLGIRLWGEIKDRKLVDWWVVSDEHSTDHPLSESDMRSQQFSSMQADKRIVDLIVDKLRDYIAEITTRSENPAEDGKYSLWRLESEEAPALSKHLVITGDAGSGKSTLVKHLALSMAGAMLPYREDDPNAPGLHRLGFWPHPPYTPIMIELRALVRTAFPDSAEPVTLDKVFAYVEAEHLKPYGISQYLTSLRDQLRDGDAMIFLDGLDEVLDAETPERREQIKMLVHLLRQQYPNCHILVTSRPYAYAGDWQLEGFGQVKLALLDADRLEELALRLFTVVLGTEHAKAEAEMFKQQMENVTDELRRSPLFFTLLSALWLSQQHQPADQRLPMTAGAIYRECVEMLIRRWTYKDRVQTIAHTPKSLLELLGLNEPDLRRILQTLAYQAHSTQKVSDAALVTNDDAEFTGGAILDVVEALKLRRVDIYGLKDALAHRAGVMYERAPNRYHFAHRSFQEHLAVCYLLADDQRYPTQLADHLKTQPGLWRNVFNLLPDEAQRHRRDLWKLVKLLLPDKGTPIPTDRDDPLWYSLYYAVHLMFENLPQDDDLQQVYRPRLREWLLHLITVSALNAQDRAEMGRVLATIGDQRAGVGVVTVQINGKTIELPQLEWCDIPAPPNGVFMMGADDQSDNPRRETKLTHNFKMAKYLITYQQFEVFVKSGEYDQLTWWKGFPKEYQPQAMAEQNNPYANHPRDRVSWYQAVAFTRWLTAKYRDADWIGIDEEIRLPTEQEWEYAARGTDERQYPYQGAFDAAKSNIRETGIGQTSAVGIFPDGASPFGVLDMSGNLWEWCLNDYDGSNIIDNLQNNKSKVLRGGSFYIYRSFAATSYRYYFNPFIGLYDGLRVVLSAPMRL